MQSSIKESRCPCLTHILHYIPGNICLIDTVSRGAAFRSKRQTYSYNESLKQYARVHPKTKIITGTVGRYAPHEWPDWYTRTLFKWNGEFRMGPYHPNDALYEKYQRSKIQGLDSSKLRRL
ncbi:unnamed protein product [Cercopithifilaria johnstoni]|uniref:Uncharacterized protein n=1 Tax=Cercopithifilaria johnstoni TaxID=2874296 RepID=A0A8J2Q1C9_9BILA|nr:unnamed protein product [Cercopithifilaria johnstoni]